MFVNRDLYVYTCMASPYRKHFFELLAQTFRSNMFHFYLSKASHLTWNLDWSDWKINGVMPGRIVGFGRFKFTTRMLKQFFTQKKGSVYIVGEVQAHGDWWLIVLLGILRRAVVLRLNDAGFPSRVPKAYAFKFKHFYRLGCCAAYSPGEAGRRYSRAFGFRDDQIVNCYFSHDVDLFQDYYREHHEEARRKVRERLGIPSGAIVALTVARLLDWKRLDDSAEALLLFEQQHPDVADNLHYVLIGVGPCHTHEPILRQLKHVKCHLVAEMPPQEVLDYYCASDVLLFPSEGDIWGLAVNEALSMSLPVVCTDVIGAAELVHDGENGFKVPPRNPQVFCEAMARLLTDDDCRRRLSANAFAGIQNWKTSFGVENLVKFLAGK